MTDGGISTWLHEILLPEDVQHLAVDLPVPERRVGDADVRPAVAVQPLRVAQRQAPHVRIHRHRQAAVRLPPDHREARLRSRIDLLVRRHRHARRALRGHRHADAAPGLHEQHRLRRMRAVEVEQERVAVHLARGPAVAVGDESAHHTGRAFELHLDALARSATDAVRDDRRAMFVEPYCPPADRAESHRRLSRSARSASVSRR